MTTALELVRRARRRLAAVVALSALLWGVSAALAVVAAAALVRLVVPLPAAVYAALWPLAGLAALASAGVVVWRGRGVRSLEGVALWIEERQPELRYALVTAIDPGIGPADVHAALHREAARADVSGLVGRAVRRALGRALGAVVVLAVVVFLLEPQGLLRAAGEELVRRAVPEAEAALASRLVHLTARVVPPSYSRLPEAELEEPEGVSALVGSRITFAGSGPADGVVAVVEGDTLAATARSRSQWGIDVTMPAVPTVVAFHDREYRRLVVLEPRADSVPVVRLRLPARDTTYQTVPRGRLVVEAELTDDLGLDYGVVEYMVTRGGQESFETKLSYGARVVFGNARRAVLREAIDLDTMGLGPGTVLHIRVVAFDGNDVTGPGKGVSETRTLRIAEPEDSVSINPAPPLPIDSMWMSQRRLNMKTDTLIRDKPRLDVKTFVHTSSAYGNAQEEIRQRAIAVIGLLEDDGVGGSFETQVSRLLREAVDLMYEARVLLGIAKPDSAMPYMVRVLEILDEIRLANRYYLRGVVRPEAVNVERVRLTGEDPAGKEVREPRRVLEDVRERLAERIERAAALARSEPAAAADSLVYVRVAALVEAPGVAEALEGAIEQLRRGVAADSALARVRRALEPAPVRLRGPVEWGGIP